MSIRTETETPAADLAHPEEDILRTVDEQAALWKVHPDVVRTLIKSQALRAHKVGRVIRIKPCDADAYLDTTLITA